MNSKRKSPGVKQGNSKNTQTEDTISLLMAEKFLKALDPAAEKFLIQTFADGDAKVSATAKLMPGNAFALATLSSVNANGSGVFVCVNALGGEKRANANVTKVRAVFADFDNVSPDLDKLPLPPHLVIESGGKLPDGKSKMHVYWLVDDDFPLDKFKGIQKQIATQFGADPVVNDLARVMRLPGFIHRKGKSALTRMVSCVEEMPRYSYEQIAVAFPVTAKPKMKTPPSRVSSPDYCKIIREAPVGKRNDTLNREAYRVFSAITDVAEIKAVALDMKEAAIEAGLTEDEVESTLDSAHKATRKQDQEKTNSNDDVVEELKPWDAPVNGELLLNEIQGILSKHMGIQAHQITGIALWILASYEMNGWRIFPRVLITSPQKRCGKSTLMEVMEGLVKGAMVVSNISPAAVFRSIELWNPTLLIDEADTFVKENPELNGIINSGHSKRHASVVRTVKTENGLEPRKFSTWAPMVIAGIGSQRGTLHDRSIHIELIRVSSNNKLQRIPADYYDITETVRRKCLRWMIDNQTALQQLSISVPPCNNSRMQDNWLPLFTVAKTVGGVWLCECQKAYANFAATDDTEETDSVILVKNLLEIVQNWKHTYIWSADLVRLLLEPDDSHWKEYRNGKPLTQTSLAKLLKAYGLISGSCRIPALGSKILKGYKTATLTKCLSPYA